jgi:glycerol-3-phosphate O-acyltransferase
VPKPSRVRAAATTCSFALRNLGQMILGRWHRFGYVCVSFGSPISFRRYCQERGANPRRLDRAARFAFVEELGDHLMAAVASAIPVVPVAIVATVFRDEAEPVTELELKARASRLMDDLEDAGAQIYIPRQDREYAIEVGLRMLSLRRVVENVDGLHRAVPTERELLDYYASSIGHFLEVPAPKTRSPRRQAADRALGPRPAE